MGHPPAAAEHQPGVGLADVREKRGVRRMAYPARLELATAAFGWQRFLPSRTITFTYRFADDLD